VAGASKGWSPTRNYQQSDVELELRVELGIGLGLILALSDFLPRHTIRPGADYQPVLIDDINSRSDGIQNGNGM
jgi:hypothetical protein